MADRDGGATAVEYALVAGLIVVVIVVSVAFFGQQVLALFQLAVDRWP